MTDRSPALSRRAALGLGAGTAVGLAWGASVPARADAGPVSWAALEDRYDVRIGLAAKNLRTGRSLTHRPDERFPIMSVFKMLAVAAVLERSSGRDLGRRVPYGRKDLVENAPITTARVAYGMDLGEICDAALRYSDNTAGNLLLRRIGGPAGLTAYARGLGGRRTRLDRWETALNSAIPGDDRDTTTPRAIAATAVELLTGDRLAAGDRWQLRAWMQGNTTSANKLRAELPAGWSLADKTGGGAYAAANDVGVAWAPDGTPVVIALLTHGTRPDQISNEAVFPEVERLVFQQLN